MTTTNARKYKIIQQLNILRMSLEMWSFITQQKKHLHPSWSQDVHWLEEQELLLEQLQGPLVGTSARARAKVIPAGIF